MLKCFDQNRKDLCLPSKISNHFSSSGRTSGFVKMIGKSKHAIFTVGKIGKLISNNFDVTCFSKNYQLSLKR